MQLRLRDVSKMLGINVATVAKWCRIGVLRASHDDSNRSWTIDVEDLIDLLEYNPEQQENVRSCQLPSPYCYVRDYIIEKLSGRKRYLTLNQISDILGVCKQAIWIHVKNGTLLADEHKTTSNGILVTEENFHSFLSKINWRKISNPNRYYHILHYIESHNLQGV